MFTAICCPECNGPFAIQGELGAVQCPTCGYDTTEEN